MKQSMKSWTNNLLQFQHFMWSKASSTQSFTKQEQEDKWKGPYIRSYLFVDRTSSPWQAHRLCTYNCSLHPLQGFLCTCSAIINNKIFMLPKQTNCISIKALRSINCTLQTTEANLLLSASEALTGLNSHAVAAYCAQASSYFGGAIRQCFKKWLSVCWLLRPLCKHIRSCNSGQIVNPCACNFAMVTTCSHSLWAHVNQTGAVCWSPFALLWIFS
jgi:hypothetical protein